MTSSQTHPGGQKKVPEDRYCCLTFTSGVVLACPLSGPYTFCSGKESKLERSSETDGPAEDRPVSIKFPTLSEDAFVRGHVVRSVWVIKHSETALSVFSLSAHILDVISPEPGRRKFECPVMQASFQ